MAVIDDFIYEYTRLINNLKAINGGKGSGNFGHKGRKGQRGGSSKDNYSDFSYNAQIDMMVLLAMTVAEFKQVEAEIDKYYEGNYKNESIIEHYMPNFIYYAKNYGFHKYKFYDIKINENEIEDWQLWL